MHRSTASPCDLPFDHYYEAVDFDGNVVRTFFIVRKALPDENRIVPQCRTDGGLSAPYKQEVKTPYVWFSSLSDDTLLFWEPDRRYVMRLDSAMRAHTSLQETVFVMDADPIAKDIAKLYDPKERLGVAELDFHELKDAYLKQLGDEK